MKESNTSERLKTIMRERGLTQAEILEKCNIVCRQIGEKELTKGALSQYVNGKVEPKQNKVYILAKALDVSEPWIMGLDVDRERIFDDRRRAFSPVNFARRATPVAYREDEQDGEWEQMLADLQERAQTTAGQGENQPISADEQEVIHLYRSLTESQKKRVKSLIDMVKNWGEE